MGGVGVIAVLFVVKMATKILGVWPTAAVFGLDRQTRTYTTLLMATGLTFGSISALYGLEHHLIDSSQYSELVTAVILSALVPTVIAQRFFSPGQVDSDRQDAVSAGDAGLVRPRRPSR